MQRFDREEFESGLVEALGLDGGEVSEEVLVSFLEREFGKDRAADLRQIISEDLAFFKELDPASQDYSEAQILSVRRGMAAIAAHRLFQEVLSHHKDALYDIEVIAKYVQKDTNVEIHPTAQIEVPFAIDHGHSTVIGATARIGKRTFIYHGVTLGASKKRSAAERRHPMVGNQVFLGNGSQILGPAVVKDNVHIAASVIIRDSLIEPNVKIAMGVRIAETVIPAGCHVFAADPENLKRYWVREEGSSAAAWKEFACFKPCDVE